MFRLEDSLWWYVGMRRIVERLIRRELATKNETMRILDAGCGTGGSLAELERFGQVTAFDFSRRALDFYLRRQRGSIVQASVDAIPFADASFDLVTSFDVICQIPASQEDTALREMGRVLKPSGGLLLRVPAFQFLYGPHDVVLQTQHRYASKEMTDKLRRGGFQPLRVTYANTLLFPVALARRLLAKAGSNNAPPKSDVRPVPHLLNKALAAVLSAEAPLIERRDLPVGLSLIAVARKL